MTIFQALVLGIVQGLTEFIPVSSSAHLVLVPALLGWRLADEARFAFDVLVQLGTLVAVLVYFRHDLVAIVRAVLLGLARRRPLETAEARLGWLVALATLPAVVAGLAFKDQVEAVFGDPRATAMLLVATAVLLLVSEGLSRRWRGLDSLNGLDALVVGAAQALALLPGISRSGATISGGLWRGLDRPAAARFSFLMSVPALLGAGVLATLDLLDVPGFTAYLAPVAVGFVAAAIVGYVCIRWLLAYLGRHSLYVFAAYCAVAGVLAWVILAGR